MLLAVAVATAQVGPRPASSQNPTQTPQADPPKATALILGQVIDGTSGQPVQDAIVTLAGGRGRGAGGGAPNIGAAFGGGAQGQQIAATAAAFANALGGGRGGANGPQRVMTGA